ncbi:MAG: glutamate 5-kinase, partial [Sphingobium sp.]|nr:glutamate 5-kinase [Sphingobium sp.]
IGQAARADAVVLLSDVDGLYTANPHSNPAARLVSEVKRIDAAIVAMADGGSGSGMGSGGMASKIAAAQIACSAGAHLAIISGLADRPLSAWEQGANGTIFLGQTGNRARKNWLAGRLVVKGRVIVDAGARTALTKGNSLLPAGVARVEGRFARGDVVDICGADGPAFARGLVEYDAEEAVRIAGKRSEEIVALLGEAVRPALVHRDHMVML